MAGVHVLGNPTARGGRDLVAAVAEELSGRGIEAIVIEEPTPALAADAARRAIADGATRLLAVGGDGVVNIAVNAAAQTDAVLGIVPHGTGNDFARSLGLLGGSLGDEVDLALSDPKSVDAIRSDHGWIATVATLGFSGDVTARANDLAWPRGQLRYTVATLLQLPRLRTLQVITQVNGRRLGTDTTLLAIGNTPYFGGGMQICPAAEVDDGKLQAVSIGAVSRFRFLRVFPAVFSGRHVQRPEVSTDTGTIVTVEGADPTHEIELWADGELIGPLPLTLEVVPGALRIAGAN